MDGFIHYLQGLLGACVQVERGGPEACQGWLQSVQADYLTLHSADHAELHLPLHHIRSVTLVPGVPPSTVPPLPDALPVFAEVLKASVGRVVRLYHAGPEVSVGILRSAAADHVLLETTAGEMVCFALFHIRSLYLPAEGAQAADLEAAEPLQEG